MNGYIQCIYSSAIDRNNYDVLTTWMNLKYIMLSERSQTNPGGLQSVRLQKMRCDQNNLAHTHTHKLKKKVLVAQSCPILCDPMDCSAAGSFVHEILQVKILKCIATPFSRGSS